MAIRIGRNDINRFIRSTAPHENSALAAAKRANEEGTKFDLDKLWINRTSRVLVL
jgi:hypothetical protein